MTEIVVSLDRYERIQRECELANLRVEFLTAQLRKADHVIHAVGATFRGYANELDWPKDTYYTGAGTLRVEKLPGWPK